MGAHDKALELLEPLGKEEAASYLAEKVSWRLADCRLALGDVAEAQPLYESLVAEARDESVRLWARYGMGRCHQERQEYNLAITEFMAIAWEPHVAPEVKGRAKLAAGACYEARGEVNTALRIYASIVRDELPGKDEAERRRQALEKGASRPFENETGGDAEHSDGRIRSR